MNMEVQLHLRTIKIHYSMLKHKLLLMDFIGIKRYSTSIVNRPKYIKMPCFSNNNAKEGETQKVLPLHQ